MPDIVSFSTGYMAPEVGLGKPYSISCDVYSFAMMLAQMLTSKLPYENHTTMDMVCKVWQGSERPDLRCFEFIPEPIKVILGQAWGSSIQRRPTMKEICHVLASEMNSEPPMKKTIEWLTTESSCPCCQKTEMRIEQRDEINQEPPPFFLPEHRALEV